MESWPRPTPLLLNTIKSEHDYVAVPCDVETSSPTISQNCGTLQDELMGYSLSWPTPTPLLVNTIKSEHDYVEVRCDVETSSPTSLQNCGTLQDEMGYSPSWPRPTPFLTNTIKSEHDYVEVRCDVETSSPTSSQNCGMLENKMENSQSRPTGFQLNAIKSEHNYDLSVFSDQEIDLSAVKVEDENQPDVLDVATPSSALYHNMEKTQIEKKSEHNYYRTTPPMNSHNTVAMNEVDLGIVKTEERIPRKLIELESRRTHINGEERLQCFCGKMFRNQNDILLHIQTHLLTSFSKIQFNSSKMNLSCALCHNMTFPLQADLVRHLWTHARWRIKHGNRKSSCDTSVRLKSGVSEQPFISETSRNDHTYNGNGRNHTLSCDTSVRLKSGGVSEQPFISKKSCNDHTYNIHRSERQTRCESTKCQKNSHQTHNINTHALALTRQNLSECKEFKTKMTEKSLYDHILSHRTNFNVKNCYECIEALKLVRERAQRERPRVECKVCCKTLASKKSLERHSEIHSDQPRVRYQCDLCPKSFAQKSHLKAHFLSLHSGRKPIECQQCHKICITKTQLRIHMLIHGSQRFECKVCHKTLASEKSLKGHSAIHGQHLRKRIDCDQCYRSFLHKSNLNAHVRAIHSGEKWHECLECHKLFAYKGNLTDHTRRHHSSGPSSAQHNAPSTLLRKSSKVGLT